MISQVPSSFTNWPGLVVSPEQAAGSIRAMPQRTLSFPDHLRAHGDLRMPKVDFASLVDLGVADYLANGRANLDLDDNVSTIV